MTVVLTEVSQAFDTLSVKYPRLKIILKRRYGEIRKFRTRKREC